MAKVLRWLGKNGGKRSNDDENYDSSAPSQYLKTKHKVEWIKQHETSNRDDLWTDRFDGDFFGSLMERRQKFDQVTRKNHYTLYENNNNSYHNDYSYNNNYYYYSYYENDYRSSSFNLKNRFSIIYSNNNESKNRISNLNKKNKRNFSIEEKFNEHSKRKQLLHQRVQRERKRQSLHFKSPQRKIRSVNLNLLDNQEQLTFNYDAYQSIYSSIDDDLFHQLQNLSSSTEIETSAEIIIETSSQNKRTSISSFSLHSIKCDTKRRFNNNNDDGKRLSDNIDIIDSNDNNGQHQVEYETDVNVDVSRFSLSSKSIVRISIEDYGNNDHVVRKNLSSNSSNKRISLNRSSSNGSNLSSKNKETSNSGSKRSSILITTASSLLAPPDDTTVNATGNEKRRTSLMHNFARCNTCRKSIMEYGYTTQWCQICESKRFERDFETWTSGNDVIDCFILGTQFNARSRFDYLTWIPFDKFKNIRYVGSGGFGSVYQAIWLDGPREKWDKRTCQYVSCGEWKVALKQLHNSKHITADFFAVLSAHMRSENNSGNYVVRYYGITQDPKTDDYVIVEQFARKGSLQSYIKKNRKSLTWKRRLDMLFCIAAGITRIHSKNLFHKNLHSGNILLNSRTTALISDLGLSHQADKMTYRANVDNNVGGDRKAAISESPYESNGTYGVLPYVAPEVMRGKPYTKASVIYSFGVLMWEIAFNKKPFSHRAHDIELARDICDGMQLDCEMGKIPKCYKELMQSCWNLIPSNRPTAEQLYKTLGTWLCKVNNNVIDDSGIVIQFNKAEKEGDSGDGSGKEKKVDPGAIYISRFLRFPELQEPTIILPEQNDP